MGLEINTSAYRSGNYNSRAGKPISAICLHTTEGDWDSDARWMCDPDSGVSCHVTLAPDGSLYQLVDDEMRAWHAGSGSWNGITDLNSYSLGLEISHMQGHGYGPTQWAVAADLCQMWISRYSIIPSMICAHRWYAPTRKIDPTDVSDHFLKQWIAALYDAGGVWRNATIDLLNIREGPGTQYPVALDGVAQLAPGQTFEVDDLTPSDDASHPDPWLHLMSQVGFVYSPLCQQVA